ncbi:anti-sigma factor domain-containing protein [Lederbergia wuyishanensis]|uniref:Anti-sigma-W factor RsiW n=1 Tax=Lederbergia wuyishanensis TaxID=1347903 RepID=A0ABU0D839_9BACI|nr:anti-sigma factor [Lederbergia wuyishanensis]MCJ8009278.1 anti-sigma factor [Lederbergia wuyishanensis]MDQ0344588.1 hypothetical protein [Lederbergia wuyishanensis]
MINNCENLSLYIADELSEQEKERFERHLVTCSSCRNEVDSLQEMWHLLSYDIEEVDVPETLKSEVMNFIFDENTAHLQAEKKENPERNFFKKYISTLTKQFSPISLGITAILLMLTFGLTWNNYQLKESLHSVEYKTDYTTKLISTFSLKGQNIASSANGTAYLLQEGNDTSLVISFSNMPSTKNEEVYQVWLLKDGNRENAGTLKPDLEGKGFLTYRLQKDQSFDNIGVTLEPHPNNTQPQGQKVMGSL